MPELSGFRISASQSDPLFFVAERELFEPVGDVRGVRVFRFAEAEHADSLRASCDRFACAIGRRRVYPGWPFSSDRAELFRVGRYFVVKYLEGFRNDGTFRIKAFTTENFDVRPCVLATTCFEDRSALRTALGFGYGMTEDEAELGLSTLGI